MSRFERRAAAGAGDQRSQRFAHKRDAILVAATQLFLARGYDGTSMDDVAAMANVSKPTVYNHFTDKEQLFAAIILSTTGHVDEIVRLVADSLVETTDLERDLRTLARRMLGALMEPQLLRLRRLVIATAERFPELGQEWYAQGFERVLNTLGGCFEQLAERGLLRPADSLLAANHFAGLLLWIPVNQAMFSGTSEPSERGALETYADAAVAVFLAAYQRPRAARTPRAGIPVDNRTAPPL